MMIDSMLATIVLLTILSLTFLILFFFKNRNCSKLQRENRRLQIENSEISNERNLRHISLNIEAEKVEFEKSMANKLSNVRLSAEKEINQIKELHREQVKEAYEEGFSNGINNSRITVKITPFKNHIKSKGFFKDKSSIEIGYRYQLFSNDIPCLEAHKEIIENLKISEINQDNINHVIDVLESIIERIPVASIGSLGSLKPFKKGLQSLVKKK